jgi:3-deoxy-D-manno-octulosonic-acid transferase
MFFIYSILLTVGFVLLLPRFVTDAIFNGKYAAGFKQRLGFVPNVDVGGKPIVWIHCVSVGETNAALPLVEAIAKAHPEFSIVVSTTTATGQQLARSLFSDIADLVFYFPFDWSSTVRRTLMRIHPTIVLLMETELWFNFLHETNKQGVRLAIVNGRLSEKSFVRFHYIASFIRRVLSFIDLALMQEITDADRIVALGLSNTKVRVTGNIKFDHLPAAGDAELSRYLQARFNITSKDPLIIAASTHSPEEDWVLAAFMKIMADHPDLRPRLLIAPRHPERFEGVAASIRKSGLSCTKRSEIESAHDQSATVILLDSIGELRSAYPLAEVVFVGGSLVPHGGQSILEPATAGRAIVTGPYTANFDAAVSQFLDHRALVQLPILPEENVVPELATALFTLLSDQTKRSELGRNAMAVMANNRGAVSRTLDSLTPWFRKR